MSSSYARTHLVLAGALPVLVLVQATLAGQHLFEGSSISVHGILGEVTFALTVVGLVLAIVRRCDGLVFGVAVVLMALAFARSGSASSGARPPRRPPGTSPSAWRSSGSPPTSSPC